MKQQKSAEGYSILPTENPDERSTESDLEASTKEVISRTDSKTRDENADFLLTVKKIASAVFYGLSSVLIVFVNKILLTNLHFPSFYWVGIGQMAVTIILLFFGRLFGLIKFPSLDVSIPRRIFPLPFFYALNLVSGLGGTQKINLPMFTVLRRFSILITMILEFFILDARPTFAIQLSVILMILGSIVAGIYDLSFDAYGYFLVFLNNIFTAANGVYVKKKLESRDLGKYGLMYYNSLFMIVPTVFATVVFTDDLEKIRNYFDSNGVTTGVIFCFLLSCVCGFILNYSLVLCSTFNSALTTTCVGPIKNLIVTYGGMISSGDYVFEWPNFIGVNISVLGSILYTYSTFRSSSTPAKTERRRKGRVLSNYRQVAIRPTDKALDKEKLLSKD